MFLLQRSSSIPRLDFAVQRTVSLRSADSVSSSPQPSTPPAFPPAPVFSSSSSSSSSAAFPAAVRQYLPVMAQHEFTIVPDHGLNVSNSTALLSQLEHSVTFPHRHDADIDRPVVVVANQPFTPAMQCVYFEIEIVSLGSWIQFAVLSLSLSLSLSLNNPFGLQDQASRLLWFQNLKSTTSIPCQGGSWGTLVRVVRSTCSPL